MAVCDTAFSSPQAGTRFPNPKQAPEKFGSFHTECMCVPSVRLCFCVWRYSVCESHPLTAGAELSLIQLCLLSCLLAAPAPWCSSGSAMAFPSCFFFVCLWPRSGSLGLPFRALSLFFPPCLVAAWAPDNPTCLFSFLFFFLSCSQLFIHLANSLLLTCSAKLLCGGDGGR